MSPKGERMWENMLIGPEEAKETVVFSGGVSNIIDKEGKRIRNLSRDKFNEILSLLGVKFFDPQIHEDTHGREYDYEQDGPAEKIARDVARVTVYQFGPEASSVVTGKEIMDDAKAGKRVVVWFSGNENGFENGKPVFKPELDDAIERLAAEKDDDDPEIAYLKAHIAEYRKIGQRIRSEVLTVIQDIPNVMIVENEKTAIQAVLSLLEKIRHKVQLLQLPE